MGKTFQSGIISRLVVGGGTYAVLHGETQIDVDNSNGLPTIIKLQPIDPSLGQCTVYINDYGNNSSVGNITIVASGGNLINGQPTLVLDTDGIGAEISVADQKSFIASLNNDSQGGGGSITGAFNGLSVSGTNIILGGALTMPTTIDALGSNTFSINDQAGLMFKTRDALGNFFFNNIGGTGTLVGSSQYIFSYLGDGGNVFTDSLIVINFGGANHFTSVTDFWNFGDYTQANLSNSIFNIGRFNNFDNVSSTTVMGYSNDLNAVYSSTILGSGNTYGGLNQKFILGNNNNNLIIDGVTGILSSEATYNNTSFAPLNNIVGVDMNGDFYNTGLNASGVLTGAGLPNYVSKWLSGSDLAVSQLFDNGINVGINTITPSAKLHLKGIDATSSNYALKVDNSASTPLLYVRNDGNVGIGTSTPSALLDIVAVDNVPYAFSIRNNTHTTNPLYGQKIYQENNGRIMYSIDSQHYMHVSVGGSVCYTTDGYVSPDTQLITQAFAVGSASYALYAKGISNNGLTVDGDGNVGINQFTATAKLHIQGIDSTSSNFALKVDNSASSPLLYVKNDGYVNVGLGNITLGVHTAAPSVSAIFMGVIPNGDNYSIAQIGGATYINGVNTVSYTVNGSVKGITNSTYTQFTQPFAIGTLAPSGSNAFVVSGESYLRGISSTSADYALKVDNLASSPLLYVRNDGKVGIGTSTPSAKLDVNGQVVAGLGGGVVAANDSPFYAVRANAGSPNYYSGFQYVFEVGGGVWGIGMNYANNEFQFLTNGASTGKFIFGYGNPTTPHGKFIMDMSSGYFGANTTTPLATIHGIGLDSTSGNYALKIDNSSLSSLLKVRNDGLISMPSLQIGNVGLVSGDLYVDTSANILANGDLVVGRKV